ncbi:MAG: histone H1 [Fimbriimonadaceae bacterium]
MSDKPPRDPNEAAHRLLAQVTGEYVSPKKRRARQGAAARSEALTPEQRSEIARNAAAKRWAKPQPNQG